MEGRGALQWWWRWVVCLYLQPTVGWQCRRGGGDTRASCCADRQAESAPCAALRSRPRWGALLAAARGRDDSRQAGEVLVAGPAPHWQTPVEQGEEEGREEAWQCCVRLVGRRSITNNTTTTGGRERRSSLAPASAPAVWDPGLNCEPDAAQSKVL